MKSIDTSEAIIYHLSWKLRLKRFVEGREDITESGALSHKDSELGKWLHADVMQHYGKYPEGQGLEKVHTTFR